MKYAYFALLALLLSSCSSTFYYSTLNTTTEYVEKVDNGDFLLETDSLWIAYCFKGANAPMQITIFNKMDEPLYIDWGRSAMVMDGMAFSYAGESTTFLDDIQATSYSSDSISAVPVSKDVFDGGVQFMSDRTSYIPPNSMISEIPLSLDPNFKDLDKKLYRSINMADKYNGLEKANRADFTVADSPLQFKSYLTLYSTPDKPMIFEQDFYMSSLIKTGLRPSNLPGDMMDKGDLFYIEQVANKTPLYTTLGIIGLGGLIAVGIIYGDEDYFTSDDDYDDDY